MAEGWKSPMVDRRTTMVQLGLAGLAAAIPGAAGAAIASKPGWTIKGPLKGGKHGWAFGGFLGDLSKYGYVEEEYVLDGTASRYSPVGEFDSSGKWSVTEQGQAPFRTRLVVQRPLDPKKFNGTVLVEWNNVSAGYDTLVHDEPPMIEAGFVYVGASVQMISIEEVEGTTKGLKVWDPERYNMLSHPGEAYCYDMFTLAGRAVGPNRPKGGIDPLHGLSVKRVVAVGSSQSSNRLTTYINAFQQKERVFNAFLLGVAFGRGAGLDDSVMIVGRMPSNRTAPPGYITRFRDDLSVPLMVVNSEFEVLPMYASRQPDTDLFRFWEVAGASHVSAPMEPELDGKYARDFGGKREGGPPPQGPISAISWVDVADSATRQMQTWLTTGTPPKSQPRMDVVPGSPPSIVRDEFGIAKGGIRLPSAAVPTAHNDAAPGNGLSGHHVPFDAQTLQRLYPSHADYVEKVRAVASACVDAGVLLPARAEAFVTEATNASIPPSA